MLESDAEELRRKVAAVMEYDNAPKTGVQEILDQLQTKTPKTVAVKKCCQTCIFYNPNETCENYLSPLEKYPRKPGDWARIPADQAPSVYCAAWIEAGLAKLLLQGYQPGGIPSQQRRPQVEVPENGLKLFAKLLEAQLPADPKKAEKGSGGGFFSRLFGKPKAETPPPPVEEPWPEMDARLKEILVIVEERRNQEMWPQYRATLFAMDNIAYINSILDRLVQKPDANVAAFFEYVIDSHSYLYRLKFGDAKESGPKTFARILQLLENDSETVRKTALALLNGIARQKMAAAEPPKESMDPNLWREWARTEFANDWKGNLPA